MTFFCISQTASGTVKNADRKCVYFIREHTPFGLVLLLHRPILWSSGQSSWLHNRDVLCFLWGTNWIYICYVEESRPPLWSSGQSSWILNGDVLCSLWDTNWIYICYVEENRPLLWSSGQSCWPQIQRSRFDSRCYQIFWVVRNGVHSASWIQLRSYLEEKVAAPV
jgi:hypothetical protein